MGSCFPEHQGHVHAVTCCEVFHERDVRFTTTVPGQDLYFAPAVEWPQLDLEEWEVQYREWLRWLADNRSCFSAFVSGCLGNPVGSA